MKIQHGSYTYHAWHTCGAFIAQAAHIDTDGATEKVTDTGVLYEAWLHAAIGSDIESLAEWAALLSCLFILVQHMAKTGLISAEEAVMVLALGQRELWEEHAEALS